MSFCCGEHPWELPCFTVIPDMAQRKERHRNPLHGRGSAFIGPSWSCVCHNSQRASDVAVTWHTRRHDSWTEFNFRSWCPLTDPLVKFATKCGTLVRHVNKMQHNTVTEVCNEMRNSIRHVNKMQHKTVPISMWETMTKCTACTVFCRITIQVGDERKHLAIRRKLVRQLVFWAQSTTTGYIRVEKTNFNPLAVTRRTSLKKKKKDW